MNFNADLKHVTRLLKFVTVQHLSTLQFLTKCLTNIFLY